MPFLQRQRFEAAFGYDLTGVRLHDGSTAHDSAKARGAYAYAYGSHIVLSKEAAHAHSTALTPVLAHELVHVVQQTSKPADSPLAVSQAPVQPSQTGPLKARNIDFPITLDDVEEAAIAVGGAAVSGLSTAGEAISDTASDVGSAVAEGAEALVEKYAPGLLAFLRGGVLTQLAEMFCGGLNSVVSAVLSPIQKIDFVSTIETTFRSLADKVNGVKASMGKAASDALGSVLSPLIGLIEHFGPGLISLVQSGSDIINGGISALWENVGKPVLSFLESVGGGLLEAFTGTVDWLWELIAPLREAAGQAWNWLAEQFGLAWDSSSGIRDWLAKKASAAWAEAQKIIEPVKRPLMVVGAILLMLSPLGPVVLITQVLPPVWEKITWLANNWRDTEVVVRARDTLNNDILPFLMNAAATVRGAISGAASWLSGVVGQLVAGVQVVLGAIGPSACVSAFNAVVNHMSDQFTRLQAWADGGFAGLQPALEAVFDALVAILQPIQEFIVRLMMVAMNPPMLPIAIGAAIWLLLPDRFKPPVINFILDLIIALVDGFPAFLAGIGPLGSLLKAGILGFLRHLRGGEGVDDKARINASNKVAGLCAGGGVQFVAGFAVGLLEGLIDGILDPIKLVILLVELIVAGIRALARALSTLVPDPILQEANAFGRRLAGRMPPAGASPATTTAAPDTAPTPAPAAQTGGGGIRSRAVNMATGSITGRPQARAPPQPTPAAPELAVPAPAATPTDDFVTDNIPSDGIIMAGLSPATVADLRGATLPEGDAASMETQARETVQTQGATPTGLADLLGGAWDYMINGAASLGAMIAGALLQFLSLPDYDIGNKIGYVAGMVLLELLVSYLTAGGYTVVKQGASLGRRLLALLLRYLDLGGEILGVLGRALAPLKGPIVSGLRSARGFLGRFGFLESILTHVDDLATRLFRFGDEAAEAASHAPGRGAADAVPTPHGPSPHGPSAHGPQPHGPAGAADDVLPNPATRAADETAEASGERAAREAAASTPAHSADNAVDDLADGRMRARDEPGTGQIRDDAAKAAQFAEAKFAASRICDINDARDTAIPLLLAQLMVLKRRYRWIDTFEAQPTGIGTYRINMIASVTTLDPHYDIDAAGDLDPTTNPVSSNPSAIPRNTMPNATATPDGMTLSRGANTVDIKVGPNGRPTRVEANLSEDFGGGVRGDDATLVGRHGTAGDHGGHLVGHRFMGDTPNAGIIPQAGNLNVSGWKTMENEWADWIGKGKRVRVVIETIPPGALRPDKLRVRYQVFDPATGKSLGGREHEFLNQAGETFNRVYRDHM